MSHLMKTRKIFYHILKGNSFLFSDERTKRMLLDTILEIQQGEGWSVWAFCLTDDAAYFVTESAGCAAIRRGMREAADRFLAQCLLCLPQWQRGRIAVHPSLVSELRSPWEAAEQCRRIHRIPLEEGLAERPEDYWWSSYVTYAGIYGWRLVDCRRLSACCLLWGSAAGGMIGAHI